MSRTTKEAPPVAPTEAELRHYTPEKVEELALLPFKASVIRKKCQTYEWPHNRGAMKITLKLAHIREISAMYDVRPVAETKALPVAA
ncbi:hypothetical protein [Streptomyces sp. ISL-94]|uniref:hypothetical protein n=1 Tax=Streptomyces sp. ISL-94 TaxID=2819190 RepID=UPI001BED3B20|nr:hypothetical protein [Streptomyces sp. ISL-94]MBT2477581.1 hypothetical protein [Streptomyces sp. ISL-94]